KTQRAWLDDDAISRLLGQKCGQSVKGFAPAIVCAVGPVWKHAVVGQCQSAAPCQRLEIDTDARKLLGILWHCEREDQPAWTIDFEVGASVLHILAVTAGEIKGSPNASVDFHAYHSSRRCGEEKLAGPCRIEPSVENALDREIETARDHKGSNILSRHF